MRLDARVARLSAAAEEKARVEATARDRYFETWFRETTAAWSSPAAYQQARRDPSCRDPARERLERARSIGTIYYEEGADVLRATLLEHHHTEAYIERELAWCRETWPAVSAHPHSPFEPEHRRVYALDEEPPSVYMLAAAAARARREATPWDLRPETDPEEWTPGVLAAHLAYWYLMVWPGQPRTAPLVEWLRKPHPSVGWGGVSKRKAEHLASFIVHDAEAVQQIVQEEGEDAALAALIERGLPREEADLFIDYAGARTAGVMDLWTEIRGSAPGDRAAIGRRGRR